MIDFAHKTEKTLLASFAILVFVLVFTIATKNPNIGGSADVAAASQSSGNSSESKESSKSSTSEPSEDSEDSEESGPSQESEASSQSQDSEDSGPSQESEASEVSVQSAPSVRAVIGVPATTSQESDESEISNPFVNGLAGEERSVASKLSEPSVPSIESAKSIKSIPSDVSAFNGNNVQVNKINDNMLLVKHDEKLFFLFPVKVTSHVSLDGEGNVLGEKKSFGNWLLGLLSA